MTRALCSKAARIRACGPGIWAIKFTSLPRAVTTNGRRSGRRHSVILGYLEDGPNLVTMAMNGWGDPPPAWWLNLQAHPEADVALVDGSRPIVGRAAAQGEERDRLWARWRELNEHLDSFAARRPTATAVVVLEPRP